MIAITTKREELINRMIRIYGFENPIMIKFARLCERWTTGNPWDENLEMLVREHESNPQIEDEWED